MAGEVDGEERTPGQMCLTVPVPPLEEWVRARTAHYDASFVSADPSFAHAHLTLLAPWVAEPTDDDLVRVARVLAPIRAFTVSLSGVAVFPDGLVHAVPVPDEPFRALTAALAAEFPDHPPYGGRYDATGGPSPHVTLDRLGPDPLATALLDAAAARGLPAPNVDFALAALVRAQGLRRGSAATIFTVARIAGIVAHALEEYEHRLRFRPRASYVGPAPPATP